MMQSITQRQEERGGQRMDVNDLIVDLTGSQVVTTRGDYIQDGILYCGQCNTPKQTKISVGGRIWTPACMCDCEAQRFKEKQEHMERESALDAVKRLRMMGFTDAEMSECTFDKDDGSNQKLSQISRKYVEIFAQMQMRGKCLLLYGDVGTGKTFMSACIANALIDKGHPCLVTNFARIVNTLQGMYEGRQRYIDDLNRFDLLVLDDLASERETAYMGEIIQSIIDARYRSGKPLIVTTNLTADEMKHPEDIRKKRIYSRLFEMCIPFEVKGNDRRRDKLKKDYHDIKEDLGI
jgi:DNA replication protein DnaC